jgi:hypothetical protein
VSGQGAYQGAVRAFSLVFVLIGLTLLVTTLANGGGPASVGFLMGLVFVAIGVLRIWSATRMGR